MYPRNYHTTILQHHMVIIKPYLYVCFVSLVLDTISLLTSLISNFPSVPPFFLEPSCRLPSVPSSVHGVVLLEVGRQM